MIMPIGSAKLCDEPLIDILIGNCIISQQVVVLLQ